MMTSAPCLNNLAGFSAKPLVDSTLSQVPSLRCTLHFVRQPKKNKTESLFRHLERSEHVAVSWAGRMNLGHVNRQPSRLRLSPSALLGRSTHSSLMAIEQCLPCNCALLWDTVGGEYGCAFEGALFLGLPGYQFWGFLDFHIQRPVKYNTHNGFANDSHNHDC